MPIDLPDSQFAAKNAILGIILVTACSVITIAPAAQVMCLAGYEPTKPSQRLSVSVIPRRALGGALWAT
jgi:hypothetical protein